MLKDLIFTASVILLCTSMSSSKAASQADESETQERLPEGTIYSDQALNGHHKSAQSLLIAAQEAERHGRRERALALVRQAMELDYDDVDAHCFYATTLEEKLKQQDEKDPEAFRECIREWLMILRNEIGAEKGMTAHGISFPGVGSFYEDEDHTIEARRRLIKLAGSAPKGWETDKRYLKRVAPTSEETVSGKIVKEKSKDRSKEKSENN